MKRQILSAGLCLAICGPALWAPAVAQTASDATMPADPAAVPADTTKVSTEGFVEKGAIGNMFEIESSKLALEKSQNGQIKQFAQRMIDDHSKAAARMKVNVTGQKVPDELDPANAAKLDKLKGLSGQAFDKQYVADQVAAHDEAVRLFTAYSQTGTDSNLKSFAQETLPTLQEHQHMIQKMAVG